jgi:2,4-dienoyl-CoA reductase-like NADH-dependent reductase (Old Yellow Enzyme family)
VNPLSSGADPLSVLWEPLEIGSARLPNRVTVSAHGPGLRGDDYAAYVGERARGGAGMIVTGAIAVHPTSDVNLTWRGWEPEFVEELRPAVDAVHRAGRPLVVQVFHVGVHCNAMPALGEFGLLLAPSAIPSPVFGVIPKEMEPADIASVVEGFAVTAAHARAAGADGVEIHAAHGYLLSEFLSPAANLRLDAYGGTADRRARIVLEVGDAVRRRCGEDFVLGLKLNFDEFVGPAGIQPEDAKATLRIAHAAGLFDYFSISCGNYNSFHYLVAPMASNLAGHTARYGELARRAVNSEVPVIVTGTVRTVAQAAEIVRSGQADAVGMIRAHIADPDIVRKAQQGRSNEIRRCVGANQGCWRRLVKVGTISCTVNPTTGREATWGSTADTSTSTPKQILVVGGGPAGMKLAEVAAGRGHVVTLVERERELGGQIRLAGLLPHRGAWLHLVDDLVAALYRLGVDVQHGSPISANDIREFGADVTFLATGSVWDISGFSVLRTDQPSIPRAVGSHVVDPITALTSPDACGDSVMIVDENGDYLPLGLAEMLALSGRRVAIVTAHPGVGRKLGPDSTADLAWVLPRIVAAGVEIHSLSHVRRIEPGYAVVHPALGEGSTRVPAATVILSMLRSSDDSLYRELRDSELDVRRIGDCVAPREVDDALLEAAREAHAL